MPAITALWITESIIEPLQSMTSASTAQPSRPVHTRHRSVAQRSFGALATEGTARYLRARGIPAERVLKVHEGRPNAIDLLVSDRIQLLINTPLGKLTQQDDYAIRRAALQHRVPYPTTLSAASAACDAIIALRSRAGEVRSLQEWHVHAREMSPEWTG